MKREVGLIMLIVASIAVVSILSFCEKFLPHLTHARSAYLFPESNGTLAESIPYPAPEDTIIILTPQPEESNITVAISMDISIEGVDSIESIAIRIVPDTESTASRVRTSGIRLPELSIHEETRVNIVADIPIGFYKLDISAPDTYIREPQGYLFQVSDLGIIKENNTTFHFKLISPTAQDLPPCSAFKEMINPSTIYSNSDIHRGEPIILCKAERLIDISSPPKYTEQRHPVMETESILSSGYHYVGPFTSQDIDGVWGRNYVVDPGVRHSAGPPQFVAERAYANDSTFTKWMEAGWVEHWARDDHQYLYEYDSATNTWNYFDHLPLSVGSAVETRVYYSSSIGKWRALYHLGGGY